MSCELRTALAEDTASVETVVREAFGLYLARMAREPAPMKADYGDHIASGHVTVALQDNRIVGALIAYPRRDHLHVETVATAEAAQRKGIGSQLMAHAECLARNAGVRAIELYTNDVMRENLPFYETLGYRITGQSEEDGYDRIFFRKDLDVA